MPDPRIAHYLPDNIWRAMQAIFRYVEGLSVESHVKQAFYDGLQTLGERLVSISKLHNLRYPGQARNKAEGWLYQRQVHCRMRFLVALDLRRAGRPRAS
jgi:hypothetical protein